MTTEKRAYKRTKLLIYPSIQTELFKVVLLSNLFTAFVLMMSGFAFLLTLKNFSADVSELSDLAEAVSAISQYTWIYAVYIGTGISIVTCLTLYAWLKISNTIAGPLFNIKRTLSQYVESGEFKTIKLREGDKLQELADLINQALQKNTAVETAVNSEKE